MCYYRYRKRNVTYERIVSKLTRMCGVLVLLLYELCYSKSRKYFLERCKMYSMYDITGTYTTRNTYYCNKVYLYMLYLYVTGMFYLCCARVGRILHT